MTFEALLGLSLTKSQQNFVKFAFSFYFEIFVTQSFYNATKILVTFAIFAKFAVFSARSFFCLVCYFCYSCDIYQGVFGCNEFLVTFAIFADFFWFLQAVFDDLILMAKMLCSLNKFSQLVLHGNVWRSVWRICMWILGLRVLIEELLNRKQSNLRKIPHHVRRMILVS